MTKDHTQAFPVTDSPRNTTHGWQNIAARHSCFNLAMQFHTRTMTRMFRAALSTTKQITLLAASKMGRVGGWPPPRAASYSDIFFVINQQLWSDQWCSVATGSTLLEVVYSLILKTMFVAGCFLKWVVKRQKTSLRMKNQHGLVGGFNPSFKKVNQPFVNTGEKTGPVTRLGNIKSIKVIKPPTSASLAAHPTMAEGNRKTSHTCAHVSAPLGPSRGAQ